MIYKIRYETVCTGKGGLGPGHRKDARPCVLAKVSTPRHGTAQTRRKSNPAQWFLLLVCVHPTAVAQRRTKKDTFNKMTYTVTHTAWGSAQQQHAQRWAEHSAGLNTPSAVQCSSSRGVIMGRAG